MKKSIIEQADSYVVIPLDKRVPPRPVMVIDTRTGKLDLVRTIFENTLTKPLL